MKTLAYIGNFQPEFSTENDVRKAFEAIGWEVNQLQENRVSIPEVQRAALNSDMLLITSTWDDALPLVDMLDIYKECAEHGIPTATLHLDTFWGKSRGGRKWWRNPMFHTAFIFTADGDYQAEWARFGRNHIWLPPAVRHDAVHFGTYREEYACDVAFVGSNGEGYHEDVWGYRKELLAALREMCKRNNWSFKNPGGDQPKIDRGEAMNDFYASAKITVGDSLCLAKQKSRYFSDRVTECTGRAGTLIMPQIDVLADIYGGSVPQYEWGNFQDLESLIEYGLSHPRDRELSLLVAHKITKEQHTYINRVEKILETVGLS